MKFSLRRVGYHIVFWLFVFALFAFLYGHRNANYLDKLILQIRFAAFEISFVYFTLYYLIPKFLLKKKLFQFSSLFIIVLFLTLLLEAFAMIIMDVEKVDLDFVLRNITSSSFYWLALENTFVVILAVTIKFLKNWYLDQIEKTELEKKQLESELELLKSQVNPHFLFNTLNNINTLVFIDQQKTYDSIIKLSELLRYMIYETKADKVFLKDEIAYLKNYVELQRIRFHEESFIDFQVNGDLSKIMIAPMLFIPFVENAFKYCKKENDIHPGISITINVSPDKILFKIWNYIKNTKFEHQTGGVGIENTKKRLNLVYPKKHRINISDDGRKFIVELELLK